MSHLTPCALCQTPSQLQNSHIIPKFVGRWLKETGATPYLRQVENPNLRRQDLLTVPLLCTDCEGRFAVWENEFAREVFVPYNHEGKQSFVYGAWLLRFAVSLVWRIAVHELPLIRAHAPHYLAAVEGACEHWRLFLLGTAADPGPSEHHLFLMDTLSPATTVEVPNRFHWYVLRGVDGTLPFSQEQITAYAKLPGLLFWSGIQPAALSGWSRTLIETSGVMAPPQTIQDGAFAGFLLHRVEQATELMTGMSERQRAEIAQRIMADPERLRDSPVWRVIEAEEYWRQRREGQSPL